MFPTWSILELEKDLRRRCFRIDELRDQPFCSGTVQPSLLVEEVLTGNAAAACKKEKKNRYVEIYSTQASGAQYIY